MNDTARMNDVEARFLSNRTASQKIGFDNFMNNPPVRLLISMIPACDRPEVMEALLKEAFRNGWAAAEMSMAMASLRAEVGQS